MKTLIDKKKMSGKQLFEYYTGKKSEYASIVRLLLYATQDITKAYSILECCEKENKRLYPFYPGIGRETCLNEDIINTFEYIGSIIDGALYMGPSKKYYMQTNSDF